MTGIEMVAMISLLVVALSYVSYSLLDMWFSYLVYNEDKFKEIQAKNEALMKGKSKRR